MNPVRLYVDEDASELAVVRGLRARGVDLFTTNEAGRLGTSDQSQLAYATQLGRTIYMLNVGDFARLHRECLDQGEEHAGIVVIPDQRYSVGDKIKQLAKFVHRTSTFEMMNKMEYL